MSESIHNELHDVIDDTIDRRRKLVDAIELEGMKSIIDDPKLATVYLRALAGMDTAIIGRSRANSEEKMADSDEKISLLAAQIAKTLGSKSIFEENNKGVVRKEPPRVDPDKIKHISVPTTVTETGQSNETIEDFNRRMNLT